MASCPIVMGGNCAACAIASSFKDGLGMGLLSSVGYLLEQLMYACMHACIACYVTRLTCEHSGKTSWLVR